MNPSLLGQILSVSVALIWALAVVLFRLSGRKLSPFSLNLFKNCVAAVLFFATFPVIGQTLFLRAPALDYWLLALSGAIGIAVADTLFFVSLNTVGAGLSQVVNCMYSPFVILFSFFFLGERLTAGDVAGAAMILTSVFLASGHRPPPGMSRRDLAKGFIYGASSVALMAVGVVIVKPVLNRSPIIWATTIRLLGGVAALAILSAVVPRWRRAWRAFRPSKDWKITLPASIIGTYIAMIVWIAGIKFTQASTAAILNQTSAVFVLPLAAVVLKESVTRRKLGAVALALCGVALVTLL